MDSSQEKDLTQDMSLSDSKITPIKEKPKFDSPYTSLGSENWDEALLAAIDLSTKDNNIISPLERIVTG